jgi:hypothetical protein
MPREETTIRPKTVAATFLLPPGVAMILRRIGTVGVGWLVIAGLALAGGETYRVVMSKDRKFCEVMAEVVNRDAGWDRNLRYEHEVFQRITWTPVKLSGQAPRDGRCSTLEQARFDLDNDGREDLVIRSSFCMRGLPSDSLYVFPSDSTVLEQATWQDLGPLHETTEKFERTGGAYPLEELAEDARRNAVPPAGVFTLRPFMFEKKFYLSLTDARRAWIVIANYLQGGRLQDLCYFHAPSRDPRLVK